MTNCFIPFENATVNIKLPERFTYPFYYQPHPLSLLAVEQLQNYLKIQTAWQHDFGFDASQRSGNAENGKMFGVLVVENQAGEIGYLSTFSGRLADQSVLDNFVPPVFDPFAKDSFFLKGQVKINQLNAQVIMLESNSDIAKYGQIIEPLKAKAEHEIAAHRALMIIGRKERKSKRVAAQNLSISEIKQVNDLMSKESIVQKNQLRDLKLYWQEKLAIVEDKLTPLTDEINQLKYQRKSQSNALQQKLFNHYRFLNITGEHKTLNDIFDPLPERTPPAGSGDCAAPKLLQYAFVHGLKPLTMAEFWWGGAPKSEIRQHKNFYGACQGKCQPILGHMLVGMKVDENPLLVNPAEGKSLDIVFQDDAFLVVNKPSEFLSVPGKNIEDSVYSRIKQQFVEATGSLIVHRLDMSTSGLMVIALTKRAHKNLQQQFIARTVKKRYVALIDGELNEQTGLINLPLRGDLYDRPRQLVCHQYGKAAETQWQVIEHVRSEKKVQTRVYLSPKTGRTHQLRMHCAHVDGLNMPIVGDDLYGKKANRLHLHAEQLAFFHPITKQWLEFQVDAGF